MRFVRIVGLAHTITVEEHRRSLACVSYKR
jgi:hypothetical protein